jgi:hypothetical protein
MVTRLTERIELAIGELAAGYAARSGPSYERRNVSAHRPRVSDAYDGVRAAREHRQPGA